MQVSKRSWTFVLSSLVCLLLVGCPTGTGSSLSDLLSDFTPPEGDPDLSSEEGESEDDIDLTDDYTPPDGALEGPGEKGPWKLRLMTATSSDGLNFTRTNQIISDQADVPDMVVDKNGRIWLYYICWTVAEYVNQLVVNISDDDGDSWAYKIVNISGIEGFAAPADPDIHLLEDGTFRLYFTSDPKESNEPAPRTYYAESSNGLDFEMIGVAFYVEGEKIIDPSGFQWNGNWHLFAGGTVGGSAEQWHGVSDDGTSFTAVEGNALISDNFHFTFGNAILMDGGIRVYGFARNDPESPIGSFFSTDGYEWVGDSGLRLELDVSSGLESDHIKGPAISQLADGTYLMVYVTVIPE